MSSGVCCEFEEEEFFEFESVACFVKLEHVGRWMALRVWSRGMRLSPAVISCGSTSGMDAVIGRISRVYPCGYQPGADAGERSFSVRG